MKLIMPDLETEKIFNDVLTYLDLETVGTVFKDQLAEEFEIILNSTKKSSHIHFKGVSRSGRLKITTEEDDLMEWSFSG